MRQRIKDDDFKMEFNLPIHIEKFDSSARLKLKSREGKMEEEIQEIVYDTNTSNFEMGGRGVSV